MMDSRRRRRRRWSEGQHFLIAARLLLLLLPIVTGVIYAQGLGEQSGLWRRRRRRPNAQMAAMDQGGRR